MEILLIKPIEPGSQNDCVMPPVGLWQLREYLQNPSTKITICDEHAGDKVENYLTHKYDIIGLSIQFSVQHFEYLRLAKLCRPYTNYLIAGGIHAANTPKPHDIDAVYSGCGEIAFSQILDRIPFYGNPQFKEDEIQRYWKIGKPHNHQSATNQWMSFTASYGCNMKCGFCGMRDFWGSLKYLNLGFLDLKLSWLKSHGIEELFIEDDNIAYDYLTFVEILRLIKEYKFKWSTPNGIFIKTLIKNPNIIPLMEKSGCWRVSLPFECGNKTSARVMGTSSKYVEHQDAELLIARLHEHGIKANGFFIIGYPGETIENMKQTLEYANSLPLDSRGIYIATPYPGTMLYNICIEKGYLKYTGEDLYKHLSYRKCIIDTPEWKSKEVEELRAVDRYIAIERRKYGK